MPKKLFQALSQIKSFLMMKIQKVRSKLLPRHFHLFKMGNLHRNFHVPTNETRLKLSSVHTNVWNNFLSAFPLPIFPKSTHINPEIYFEHMCCLTIQRNKFIRETFPNINVFRSFITRMSRKKFPKIRISNQQGDFHLCCLIVRP